MQSNDRQDFFLISKLLQPPHFVRNCSLSTVQDPLSNFIVILAYFLLGSAWGAIYGVCSWGRRLCPPAVVSMQRVVTKSPSAQGQVDEKHYTTWISLT